MLWNWRLKLYACASKNGEWNWIKSAGNGHHSPATLSAFAGGFVFTQKSPHQSKFVASLALQPMLHFISLGSNFSTFLNERGLLKFVAHISCQQKTLKTFLERQKCPFCLSLKKPDCAKNLKIPQAKWNLESSTRTPFHTLQLAQWLLSQIWQLFYAVNLLCAIYKQP